MPLTLYLASFVVAFSSAGARATRVASVVLPFLVVAVAASLLEIVDLALGEVVALHLATLLAAAVALHGRLAADRPAPRWLTEFFLWLSAGGALGGLVNGLLAPIVLDDVLEYPLALVLALLVRPVSRTRRPWWAWLELAVLGALVYVAIDTVLPRLAGSGATFTSPVVVAVVVAIGLCLWRLASRALPAAVVVVALLAPLYLDSAGYLFRDRTFFGVHEVYIDDHNRNVYTNGTTIHGYQSRDEDLFEVPLGYYVPSGPVGAVFEQLQADEPFDHVGILGLGTGALAEYARPGQTFTYYEIDPVVVDIARDDRLFTYLANAYGDIEVVLGDGRLSLAAAPPWSHDLLFMDAFSSDAILVHLLTRDAVEVYLDAVADDGVLAFHVSNRHLDLEPVLAAIAADLGLAAIAHDDPSSVTNDTEGVFATRWVLLARDRADFDTLADDTDYWYRPDPSAGTLWTDDYSNLLDVIDWS